MLDEKIERLKSKRKMSRVNETNDTTPASRGNTSQLNMNQFVERDYTIRNPGYIDAMKSSFNIRLMNLNVKLNCYFSIQGLIINFQCKRKRHGVQWMVSIYPGILKIR